ncbi:MAG: hypothetical protein Q7S50_01175 [bacterium]|nr:hypothetical protein [bacterium]
MVRMWVICWYFHRFQGATGGPETWYSGSIDRHRFENHVVWERHFKEGVKDLIQRLFPSCTEKWAKQEFGQGLNRVQYRSRLAEDAINHGLEKGYLVAKDNGQNLSMDFHGRRFLFNPLVFLTAVLKEYGYIVSFIFGAGGGFIIAICIWLYNVFNG